MANEDFLFSISETPVDSIPDPWKPDARFGADLTFLGVVRGWENQQPIEGIDYSAYEAMARRQLERLGSEIHEDSLPHQAFIHHRIGFVPTGIPSLLLRVRAPHSDEAFELCRRYLRGLKTTVPIWKDVRWSGSPPSPPFGDPAASGGSASSR